MTETFAAVRDALERALLRTVPVVVESLPDLPRPWFLPVPPPPKPTAAARAMVDAAIAKGRRR